MSTTPTYSADWAGIHAILQATSLSREEDRKEFQAYQRENDRVIQKREEEFQAYKRENDRMIQESRKEILASEKRIKQLDHLFNSHWGALVESLVEGDLIKLLNGYGIPVNNVSCRRHGQKDGQNYEFDLIARNGREVVVVEVKTTLRPKDVKHFIKKLNQLKVWLPEYQENTVYGGMAWLQEHGAAATMAEKRGLFNIRATGDSSSIVNASGFKPYQF